MMRASPLLLAALVLMGCGSPLRAATETSNGVRAATLAASEVIEAECVQAVPKAKTTEDLAALRHVCDPMSDAYKAARLSHAVLVAAIAAGEQNDPALLATRVLEAAQAAAKLADAIDRARKTR